MSVIKSSSLVTLSRKGKIFASTVEPFKLKYQDTILKILGYYIEYLVNTHREQNIAADIYTIQLQQFPRDHLGQ